MLPLPTTLVNLYSKVDEAGSLTVAVQVAVLLTPAGRERATREDQLPSSALEPVR